MSKSWIGKAISWRRHYEMLLPEKDRKRVSVIPVIFSKRDMGMTAGLHTVGTIGHTIDLSPYMDEYEAAVVIGHEYAHLCDWILNEEANHGKSWKKIMCQFGLPPHEFHTLPIKARKTAKEIMDKLGSRHG